MKLLSRVVWSEGMYLGPHHFQAQARYFEDLIQFATSSLWFKPYGLIDCQFDVEALQTNLRSVIESVDSAMRRIFSMEDKEKREKTTFEMFVVYFARILPAAATLFGKGQNSPELLAFTKLSQPFTKGCWEGAVNAENLVKNTF